MKADEVQTLVEEQTRTEILFPAIDKQDTEFLFVELGSFLGGNILRCAEYAKKDHLGRFIAIDNWLFDNISTEGKVGLDKDYFKLFCNNVVNTGFEWIVTPMQADTIKAATFIEDGSVDILFIDDGHTYPHTKHVLEAWIPKVRPGGLIAGHDIPCQDVWNPVRELLFPNQDVQHNGHSYWKYL